MSKQSRRNVKRHHSGIDPHKHESGAARATRHQRAVQQSRHPFDVTQWEAEHIEGEAATLFNARHWDGRRTIGPSKFDYVQGVCA